MCFYMTAAFVNISRERKDIQVKTVGKLAMAADTTAVWEI